MFKVIGLMAVTKSVMDYTFCLENDAQLAAGSSKHCVILRIFLSRYLKMGKKCSDFV